MILTNSSTYDSDANFVNINDCSTIETSNLYHSIDDNVHDMSIDTTLDGIIASKKTIGGDPSDDQLSMFKK